MEKKNSKNNQDVENNKGIAALSYIVFFLPLLIAKDSKFCMFHANQGLLVFLLGIILSILGSVVRSMLPFYGMFIYLPYESLILLVFAIIGIINALNGLESELPLIGKIKLIN